jgi:hypothetical protein
MINITPEASRFMLTLQHHVYKGYVLFESSHVTIETSDGGGVLLLDLTYPSRLHDPLFLKLATTHAKKITVQEKGHMEDSTAD